MASSKNQLVVWTIIHLFQHSAKPLRTIESPNIPSSSLHLLSSMKFLVFGGGGKVARHFAKIAVKDGHEVISVVRNDDQ